MSSAVADDKIKASPLARKLANEKGIDLSKLKGSGDNGRELSVILIGSSLLLLQ